MRRAQSLTRRAVGLALLTGWVAGQAGCINHYYGYPVACAPADVNYGAVCEVPSTVSGGTVLAASPGRATVVGAPSAATPGAVLTSEPQAPRMAARNPIGWRRSDGGEVITSRISGAVDETRK